MTQRITTVAFDADDTLWFHEEYYVHTQDRFAELLSAFTEKDTLMDRLLEAERRNLPHYGFGIKGFTLSMIETAIDVTEGKVPGHVIAQLLDAGRDMLSHPIDLMPHAHTAVETAAANYRVLLITKGELLDQERKLAQSGLGDHFDAVEIVSNKTAEVYTRIFADHGTGVEQGLMVGNSLASDVLPMIHAGGWGIHVPHGLTWALEEAEKPTHPRFVEIADLSRLAHVLEHIHTTGNRPDL